MLKLWSNYFGKRGLETSSYYLDSIVDLVKLQKENPESYKPMIKDRNDEMVKKIEGYFKEDETYTIAVGALHFFGDDGIVKLMENKGYTVTRME